MNARSARRRSADASLAVGYIRASTDEQLLGPDAQRAALDTWARAHGVRLVAVHVDAGVSGATPIDKRPGLLAALDALRASGAGLLVVAKRDRLARDVLVAAMLERLVEREGARTESADGAGNGSGPEAEMMRGLLSVFASYERALIRGRTRMALAVKRSRGERIGSVPYGWALAEDGRRLVPLAAEQRVLDLVRAYRAEGLTLRAIGTRLEAAGILPRSGAHWHPQTVANIARALEAAA